MINVFRLISLKGSDFDTKKSLLEAIRRGFPGGSVSFSPGVKNEHVNAYWQWIAALYDPQEGVKVYGTSHLGLHSDNYWILGDEVTTYFVVFIVSLVLVSLDLVYSKTMCCYPGNFP